MRICTYRLPAESVVTQKLGIVEDEMVFDVGGYAGISHLLSEGAGLGDLGRSPVGVDLRGVVLLPPVPRPGKIVAAIVNTQAMLGGSDVRLDRPRLDMKAPSTVIGPGEEIRVPESGIRPEVELAAVIGKKLTRVSPEVAREGIFGFTVLNDVTAPSDSRMDAYEAYRRDRRTGAISRMTMRGPLFRSKNHDGFCPMGPWLTTPGELDYHSGLKMATRFDGRLIQTGSTSEYIFSPEEIASYVSGFLTLEPGDVISCGSVGWAPDVLGDLDPTEYVLPAKEGLLEVEVQGIGALKNRLSV